MSMQLDQRIILLSRLRAETHTCGDVDEVFSSDHGAICGSVHAIAAVGDTPKNSCGAAQLDPEFITPG